MFLAFLAERAGFEPAEFTGCGGIFLSKFAVELSGTLRIATADRHQSISTDVVVESQQDALPIDVAHRFASHAESAQLPRLISHPANSRISIPPRQVSAPQPLQSSCHKDVQSRAGRPSPAPRPWPQSPR